MAAVLAKNAALMFYWFTLNAVIVIVGSDAHIVPASNPPNMILLIHEMMWVSSHASAMIPTDIRAKIYG